MSASLVGSEMCIRDRGRARPSAPRLRQAPAGELSRLHPSPWPSDWALFCLLYTSDAADDM
eukprot:3947625-Alexandrium_andersonii.AAC.1